MIEFITDEDLQTDFGISVRLHRVKIIEAIKKLKVKHAALDENASLNLDAAGNGASNNDAHMVPAMTANDIPDHPDDLHVMQQHSGNMDMNDIHQ